MTAAPCLDFHVTLNEVQRAALESLDCRINSVAQVVQYNLYCDGIYNPPIQGSSKKAGTNQKAEWAFVIAAQFPPRIQDEAIVGVAAGSMIQSEMEQQGLHVQSAEPGSPFTILRGSYHLGTLIRFKMTLAHVKTFFFIF